MVRVTDEQFEEMVAQAVATIPPRFKDHLDNVAFLAAEVPTREQLRQNGLLHGRETLLGLYEGIPLPQRDGGYSGVLPDVITVFKRPHEDVASDMAGLAREVHATVWHEVAHYFGLDHGDIEKISQL